MVPGPGDLLATPGAKYEVVNVHFRIVFPAPWGLLMHALPDIDEQVPGIDPSPDVSSKSFQVGIEFGDLLSQLLAYCSNLDKTSGTFGAHEHLVIPVEPLRMRIVELVLDEELGSVSIGFLQIEHLVNFVPGGIALG